MFSSASFDCLRTYRVMAKCSVLLLLLALVVIGSGCREDEQQRKGGRFQDLRPRSPKEIFRSEGGRIEEWMPSDYRALCDANVGARRITIEPNSLAVPCYANAAVLKLIVKGHARAGVINPLADQVVQRNTVFHVREGDVVALPQGVASWFYNDGTEGETIEIVEIADTTNTPQCGRFSHFLLAGGQHGDFGSVLQGFSSDMIAHAWDVDQHTVQRLLGSQKDAAIIKLDDERKMRLPEADHTNTLFVDFVYRFKESSPDVSVPNAGELRFLSSLKLAVLKHMNMAAACVHMRQGALTAPGWIHNAHSVMYVGSGRGRVQVVRETGEQALNTEVKEGNLLVIPSNFPCVKLAGETGFRFASIFTSDRPVESFLAGRNSVYQGMPHQVVSSSFQTTDDRLLEELHKSRSEDAYLFPPRKQQQHSTGSSFAL